MSKWKLFYTFILHDTHNLKKFLFYTGSIYRRYGQISGKLVGKEKYIKKKSSYWIHNLNLWSEQKLSFIYIASCSQMLALKGVRIHSCFLLNCYLPTFLLWRIFFLLCCRHMVTYFTTFCLKFIGLGSEDVFLLGHNVCSWILIW